MMFRTTSVQPYSFFKVRDLIVFILLLGMVAAFAAGFKNMYMALPLSNISEIKLDSLSLAYYSFKTVTRMLIAVVCSLVFSIIYATLAAKSKKLEQILIPLLDILQSVPVLGYLSFTVTFFIALFPGNLMGFELAAIFAIFTSQVWNMTFSFYQSLKELPKELIEVAKVHRLSRIHRFLVLELPYATPAMVWNAMISMSGGWFFVVASEAITVGDIEYALPGVGSYIAIAIKNLDIYAVLKAILAMVMVISLYDQLLFRPLTAWANKFHYENIANAITQKSWVLSLLRGSIAAQYCTWFIDKILGMLIFLSYKVSLKKTTIRYKRNYTKVVNLLWYIALAVITVLGLYEVIKYSKAHYEYDEFFYILKLASYTAMRVLIFIMIALFVWVPVGVYIGFRPLLASKVQALLQFLAAFPVNLLFPVFAIFIAKYDLNPNIWLSPLLIVGTQWYILFNVIAGASAYPSDLRELAQNYQIQGIKVWFKTIFPAIFPYLITGAITASGGAWNASIVAELITWGEQQYIAEGVGSYITTATINGETDKIILGIATLSGFVLLFNRMLWRPLYKIALKAARY